MYMYFDLSVDMSSLPTLNSLLDLIPEDSRDRLNNKVDDRACIARIAKTIPDWPVAAEHFPGIKRPDIEAIQHDNHLSFDRQR